MKNRYSRQEAYKKIGKKGQKKINQATISIIGLGALGSTTAELLTRAGIGKLKIFDRDLIELNNIQRQSLYEEKDVGKLKAKIAEKKLKKINSKTKIQSNTENIQKNNLKLINSDLILECTDNLETKFLINRYCKQNKLKWISASAIKDIGIVIPFVKNEKCLECIFKMTTSLDNCETVGVLNTTTTITSSIQVSEAIKLITNQETKDKIIRINTTNNTIQNIEYEKKSHYENKIKTNKKILKTCDSYHITDENINFEKAKRKIKQAKITPEGIFSDEITILKNGKAIIKAKTMKKAKKIYEKTINSLS